MATSGNENLNTDCVVQVHSHLCANFFEQTFTVDNCPTRKPSLETLD